ncbi:UNVERIFIED_ORG: hypothetical protein J2X79_004282 [Arthrobacter globiformis]|nr:hypothetical protein [Arthrobacter globiformis]
MTESRFLRLPVNPDEGFPQSFRLSFDGRNYIVGLQVTIAEEVLPDIAAPDGLNALVSLPEDGAFLTVTVVQERSVGDVTLLRRKVIPGMVYRAGELALVFRTIRIALGNLHGSGRWGSEVVAGVALA